MSSTEPESTEPRSSEPDYIAIACIFDTIVANLTPYYLGAAKGDETAAARTILELIKVHNPLDPPEIELAGRIVGFAAAAADSLRLSMRPGLSDAKILRYRSSAASLDRSAEKCRMALAEMQARRHQLAEPEDQPERSAASSRKPMPSANRSPFAAMASDLAAERAAMQAHRSAGVSSARNAHQSSPQANAGR